MQRQTTIAKPLEVKREWHLIDATNIPLGRLASKLAMMAFQKKQQHHLFQKNMLDLWLIQKI